MNEQQQKELERELERLRQHMRESYENQNEAHTTRYWHDRLDQIIFRFVKLT